MANTPRIALVGATGRTGNAVAFGLAGREDVQLTACVAPSLGGGAPTRLTPSGAATAADLASIDVSTYDVVVDLSLGAHVARHAELAREGGAHYVVGATGIPEGVLEAAGERAEKSGLGVLYCPNFAIGAVLMMQLAAQVARSWPGSVEITETHHDGKLDAPSGTAARTAELIVAEGGHSSHSHDVSIHSLRLPGAVAHQSVHFGAPGELFTISHDAIDRSCYAGGVARAAIGVRSLNGLTIGLEHVL